MALIQNIIIDDKIDDIHFYTWFIKKQAEEIIAGALEVEIK